jgi:hypothetical protein
MMDQNSTLKNWRVFKMTRPVLRLLEGKFAALGRAERTEEYVSVDKWRERHWRYFPILPMLNGYFDGGYRG